jgi:hypothetical protein
MHAVRRTALVVAALALVAGACGDDDDDDGATSDTAPATADGGTETSAAGDTATTAAGEPAAGDAAAGDLAAYCDAMLAFDALESPGGPDGATAEALVAWAGEIQPLLDDVVAAAPDEAQDALATLQGGITAAGEGDTTALDDPALSDAIAVIEGVAYDGCGFTQVDVTAGDYLYEGIPASVPAGPLAIRLTNEGAEPHIILAIQRAEGNTTPPVELVDEFFAAVESGGGFPASVVGTMAGDAAFAFPGGGVGGKVTELAPGSYVLFCPIPTLADETVSHHQEGMIAELVVEG